MKRSVILLFVLGLAGGAGGVASSVDNPYREEVRDWREAREARLEADGGWLTLAGLFWLKEGENTLGTDPSSDIVLPDGSAPARAGSFVFKGEETVLGLFSGVEGRIGDEPVSGPHVMKPDTTGEPDVLELGALSLYVIQRGDRFGIRVKDANSPVRRAFSGLRWFDIGEAWRIDARWVAYPSPRPLKVPNVLGDVTTMPSPGRAEFEIDGKVVSLDGVLPEPRATELFFIFRDETSGDETYGAGRFLYSDLPKQGHVVLDFNKAYNPPCAFTPYATCPLPPKQNWLPVAVTAGEKSYKGKGAH
jgi:uncharacterized protein (DUF1684 family)